MAWNDTVHYPQDEMTTALLPVTTGCSYNRCAFCSMYKDDPYAVLADADIELQLLHGRRYTERLFLTGADPLSAGFDKMIRILKMIRSHLPYCSCVAAYASVKNIRMYSVDELAILRRQGLGLLYIGFETGLDEALFQMNKGHTADDAVRQALKLNEAQLPFHSVVMYGIAGKGRSVENALATARMVNRFATPKLITMNLTVFYGTPLEDMVKRGRFIPPDGAERLLELRTLLEYLEPASPMLFDTTHPTNIIQIKGTLPGQRRRLIGLVNRWMPRSCGQTPEGK